ncbi:MAG: RagB/SusD family nutrient uptake outer membrane protein [Cyclobacteriaceae bacterium]
MKSKVLIALSLLGAMIFVACSDLLDEEPKAKYTPEFFGTETGVLGGITSLYANLRYIYGNPYYYNSLETGTDEYTWAQSADGNFLRHDFSGQAELTAEGSRSDVLWNNSYAAINTASGVIQNAVEVGLSADLTAEARFFRAWMYFELVRNFGGVPLDLGSGELAFNTSAERGSVRNTVPEVYTRAIFPDLLTAVTDLPEAGRVTGGVTQNVARLALAKAYLTYAWWLENPNNIPTYPEASRNDPDGLSAAQYFQMAYDVAVEGINNPGPYALEEYFYDLHHAPNDRNPEEMFYADRTETSEFYNGDGLTWGGGARANMAVWMVTWNYTVIRSSTSTDGANNLATVQREAAQSFGRPWTRMAPVQGVFKETFAEKDLDARYDGTFVTSYRGNWDKSSSRDIPTAIGADGSDIQPGDAVLSFLDEDDAAIDYNRPDGSYINGASVGAGVLPDRSDYVIGPSEFNRRRYPGLWKLGTYRTDNGDGLGSPNGGLTRPFNILKFSEFYFVAAEAAVKGATTSAGQSAYDLINVIRARAGRWRFDNGDQVERIEDNSAAMVAATPATIDIDYILEERSREYFGEGYRWHDLVRTQTWADVAASYEIGGIGYDDRSAETVVRTIEPHHYLRPIPQGQIDAMQISDGEKAAYQNPGY